jgi:hypothetical protein
MNETEIKMRLEDIKKEKQSNFKERIWFIKYWAEYIKTHDDNEWGEQLALLINSQIAQNDSKP